MKIFKLYPVFLLVLILPSLSWAQALDKILIKQDALPQAIKFVVPTDIQGSLDSFVLNKVVEGLRGKYAIHVKGYLNVGNKDGVIISKEEETSGNYTIHVRFFKTAKVFNNETWVRHVSNRSINFRLVVNMRNLGNNKSEYIMKLLPIVTQSITDTGFRRVSLGGIGGGPPELPNTFESYLTDVSRLFEPFGYTVLEKKRGRVMFVGDEDRVILNLKSKYSVLSERRLRRTYSLVVMDKKNHAKIKLAISKRKENVLVKYESNSANSTLYSSDATVERNFHWLKLKARLERIVQL